MVKRSSGPPGPPERPRLTAHKERVAELIKQQLEKGEELLQFAKSASSLSPDAYNEKSKPWREYTEELLRKLFTVGDMADEFAPRYGGGSWDRDPRVYLRNLVRHDETSLQSLKSILGRLELFDEIPGVAGNITPQASAGPVTPLGRDVFIVHGRDEATKQTVARFLEKLKLNPIILHEQADKGVRSFRNLKTIHRSASQ